MPWKKNKNPLAQQYSDLEYLPPGRSAWDCTLSCLVFGLWMDVPGASADLNVWATRHGVPGSGSYEALGGDALVLWHGTSRERADKIVEHGLFHKKGLWTARHPRIPHLFCRMRSERFGTEGAMVCIVLDPARFLEGRDFEVERNGSTLRFYHGLPADVVEYVLVRDEIRFTGGAHARSPRPWPKARFKHSSGAWSPVRRAPVRFSGSDSFSTPEEFVRLCLSRLLRDPPGVSPLEALSVLYSLVRPWECLQHREVLGLLGSLAPRSRLVGKWQLFLPNPSAELAPETD
jgi:hypothetical protein